MVQDGGAAEDANAKVCPASGEELIFEQGDMLELLVGDRSIVGEAGKETWPSGLSGVAEADSFGDVFDVLLGDAVMGEGAKDVQFLECLESGAICAEVRGIGAVDNERKIFRDFLASEREEGVLAVIAAIFVVLCNLRNTEWVDADGAVRIGEGGQKLLRVRFFKLRDVGAREVESSEVPFGGGGESREEPTVQPPRYRDGTGGAGVEKSGKGGEPNKLLRLKID